MKNVKAVLTLLVLLAMFSCSNSMDTDNEERKVITSKTNYNETGGNDGGGAGSGTKPPTGGGD